MSAPSASTSKRVTAASQWSVYLALFAMTAVDVLREPSAALRPHADGLGSGFTSFNYAGFEASYATLHARATLAQQVADGNDDDGAVDAEDAPHGEEHDGERDDEQLAYHDEDDDASMEIAEDRSYDLDVGFSGDYEEDDRHGVSEVSATSTPPLHTISRPVPAPPRRVHGVRVHDLTPEMLESILEFLPVHDVNQVRSINVGFGVAAARLCPQPFTDNVTFVRCSNLASLAPPRPNPHAPPVPFYWRCVNCGYMSDNHEQCMTCFASIRQSGCRVFMGQVRKQHTAEALRCVIRGLCPSVEVLHIESHSNKDGYEKGAAWVYVSTPEQAIELTQLHKRVFFDIDSDGNEGFWYVDDQELEQTLADFAVTRKTDNERRERPLPGQPLVSEFPSGSMLRGAPKPDPLHKRSAAPAVRDGNGWYHERQQQ